MKRLVFISDTHLTKPKLPEGDILIHCGDLTYDGKVEQITRSLEWLGAQDFEEILLTPGNHDWMFQWNEEKAREICNANNITLLIDQLVDIDGIKFYGSPWQPEFYGWAYNCGRTLEESAIKNIPFIKDKWDLIPQGIDVLFTHGPARGILDYVPRGENVGCAELMDAIMRIKPKIHACGHIHYSYGEKMFNGVHFINASVCDERYKCVNKPIQVLYEQSVGIIYVGDL